MSPSGDQQAGPLGRLDARHRRRRAAPRLARTVATCRMSSAAATSSSVCTCSGSRRHRSRKTRSIPRGQRAAAAAAARSRAAGRAAERGRQLDEGQRVAAGLARSAGRRPRRAAARRHARASSGARRGRVQTGQREERDAPGGVNVRTSPVAGGEHAAPPGRPSSRRAANSRASARRGSSQCASSTTHSTGPSRPPRSSIDRVATPTRNGSTAARPPARTRPAARATCGAGAGRATAAPAAAAGAAPANANGDSDSSPWAREDLEPGQARGGDRRPGPDFPTPALAADDERRRPARGGRLDDARHRALLGFPAVEHAPDPTGRRLASWPDTRPRCEPWPDDRGDAGVICGPWAAPDPRTRLAARRRLTRRRRDQPDDSSIGTHTWVERTGGSSRRPSERALLRPLARAHASDAVGPDRLRSCGQLGPPRGR